MPITVDGRYMINEPYMDADAADSYGIILQHMSRNASAINYQDATESQVISSFEESAEILELSRVLGENYSAMMYYLRRDTVGFRIIDVLINDDYIEDITCENPGVPVGVIHRKYPEFFCDGYKHLLCIR